MSIDGFPFVGAVPEHEGQFLAAGFTGHGESGGSSHSAYDTDERYAQDPPFNGTPRSFYP